MIPWLSWPGGFLWAGNKKWGESGERMATDRKIKGLSGFFNNPQALVFIMVPEVGIEPTLSRGKGDFESPASTSFTTPAWGLHYIFERQIVKKIVLTFC